MSRPTLTRLLGSALPPGEVRDTVEGYRSLHDEAHGGDVNARRRHYAAMTNRYYDLVTDFYE